MSYSTFYGQFFLNNSTCWCLASSVLNQSSPIMNVEQAEKKKKYCDTLSFYLISFHWSHFDFYYLPPSSVITHVLLPLISPQAVVQYILKLRGRGHNNPPCLLRSFFFFHLDIISF